MIVTVHPVQVLDAQRQHFVLNGQIDEVVDEPVVARRELPGEVALDDLPLVVHHPRIADDLFGRVLHRLEFESDVTKYRTVDNGGYARA